MMFPYQLAFPIPMIIGCGMEAAAYWFRSRSHDNLRQTLPFLIQNLLVLVAPPFLGATIYMSPGRITRALKAQEASLISLRWITKLFVLVDLICSATQTAGAIMSGSEDLDSENDWDTAMWGIDTHLANTSSDAPRSVGITLVNNTNQTFYWDDSGLEHGRRKITAPDDIALIIRRYPAKAYPRVYL
ncbi:hypothetical protein LZL87_008620 [Fusarium oxysporum]|nr:hypothetical protein LZL87_008620 [Fusarium oxysporum]